MNISLCVLLFPFAASLPVNVEFCLEKIKYEKTLPHDCIIGFASGD